LYPAVCASKMEQIRGDGYPNFEMSAVQNLILTNIEAAEDAIELIFAMFTVPVLW